MSELSLFVIGASHHQASLEVREKLAVDSEEALRTDLASVPGLREFAVLNTCNRVEFYGVGAVPETAGSVLAAYCARQRFDPADYERIRFHLTGRDAALHLFEVASGLESQLLGENEIFGQVKDAYAAAQSFGSTGAILNRVFQKAFQAAKHVVSKMAQKALSPETGPDYNYRVGIQRSARRRSLGTLLSPASLAFLPAGPHASAPISIRPQKPRRVTNLSILERTVGKKLYVGNLSYEWATASWRRCSEPSARCSRHRSSWTATPAVQGIRLRRDGQRRGGPGRHRRALRQAGRRPQPDRQRGQAQGGPRRRRRPAVAAVAATAAVAARRWGRWTRRRWWRWPWWRWRWRRTLLIDPQSSSQKVQERVL